MMRCPALLQGDIVVFSVRARPAGKAPFLRLQPPARHIGFILVFNLPVTNLKLVRAHDYSLVANTGSGIIARSTKMKAGTAQKAILTI